MERLAQEHQAIGFYLSGHPLDDYARALRRERVLTYAELAQQAAAAGSTAGRIAGSVAAVMHRKSARGARYAFVSLSDPTGLYEVRVFADLLDVVRDQLEPGRNLVLTVEAMLEGDELRLTARAAQPIDAALAGAAAAGLRIYLGDAGAVSSIAARLERVRRDVTGARRGPISLMLMHPELPGEVEMALPQPVPVTPQVIGALKSAPGVVHIEEY
jgi:DNA polymerase-3 subunit alpha